MCTGEGIVCLISILSTVFSFYRIKLKKNIHYTVRGSELPLQHIMSDACIHFFIIFMDHKEFSLLPPTSSGLYFSQGTAIHS